MTKLHSTNLVRMEGHIDAEKLQSLRERYRSGRPTRHIIRPMLMAVMLTALLVAIIAVVVEISEDDRWFLLTIPLFLIALEAIYTTVWLNHPRQMPLDRTAYRGAELLLLVVLVRIVSWAVFDEGIPDSDALLQYLRTPPALFLNAHFLITLILAVIAWRMAVLLSQIFSHLEITEFELRFHSLPLAQRKARADDQPIQLGRSGLVESFTHFWLIGGLLLTIAVGLSTLEQQSVETLLAPLASGKASLDSRLLSAILLYFIIGLWLLSQARLMQVHAHWLVNNIEADGNARQKWQRTSLIILMLVIIVAAFLPIGSTTALSQIVGILIYWLLFLANILMFLLVLPFAVILALLSNQAPEDLTDLPPSPQPPTMVPPEAGTSSFAETIAMVLSSGFWAVFIGILVLALLFFWRERRQSAGDQIMADIWVQFVAWLRSVWLKLRGQVRSFQGSIVIIKTAEEEPQQATSRRLPWRFLRVSGLSPRDKIRYFYLSTVRRAGEQGVSRAPSGTPLEYVDDLKKNWPDADEELDDLTEAFLTARYSDKTFHEEDVPAVKDTWKTVRRELRQGPDRKDDQETDNGKGT